LYYIQEASVHVLLEERLDEARTLQGLQDWSDHFRILAPPPSEQQQLKDLVLSDAPQIRPRKASRYHSLERMGIGELASRLSMATSDFADSVSTITEDRPRGIPNMELVPELPVPESVVESFCAVHYPGVETDSGQVTATLDQVVYYLVQVWQLQQVDVYR
jgi:hypothetical protein